MTIAERISSIVDPMPDDGMVTLSVTTLRGWLADERPDAHQPDLTLENLRLLYFPAVSVSSLREWCQLRKFPHSYKQRGRFWRVPHCCVEELKQAERDALEATVVRLQSKPAPVNAKGARRRTATKGAHHPDTSAWRNIK